MAGQSQPLVETPERVRQELVRKWLTLALAGYPEQGKRFIIDSPDPFRNPTGRVYRESLEILAEELLGEFKATRLRPAVDELMHVCAVSGRPASEALAFLPAFKTLVCTELALPPERQLAVERRVDQLLLWAFDCYSACREKLYQARLNEIRRLQFVQDRLDKA